MDADGKPEHLRAGGRLASSAGAAHIPVLADDRWSARPEAKKEKEDRLCARQNAQAPEKSPRAPGSLHKIEGALLPKSVPLPPYEVRFLK